MSKLTNKLASLAYRPIRWFLIVSINGIPGLISVHTGVINRSYLKSYVNSQAQKIYIELLDMPCELSLKSPIDHSANRQDPMGTFLIWGNSLITTAWWQPAGNIISVAARAAKLNKDECKMLEMLESVWMQSRNYLTPKDKQWSPRIVIMKWLLCKVGGVWMTAVIVVWWLYVVIYKRLYRSNKATR